MSIREIINEKETTFVDVRSGMEFNMGHVEGAINIPLDQIAVRYREIENLGEKPVVFYCRSGARSGQAVAFLNNLGIKKIYNGGGMDDLMIYLN